MSLYKRAVALCLAVGIAAAGAGCGKNTTTALTVDGYEVPAGVYIYFANTAYSDAVNQLKAENEELDTEDKDAIKAMTLEGKDVTTWIQDKATEMCADFAVTEQKFDELGLTLDPMDESNIDTMMSYYWSPDTMEKNGISEDSFRKIVRSSYKSDAIFEYYYGIGGENGVTEDEITDYYIENNIRAQYVRISLKDSEGNLMKSDDKAKMKKLAEEYQERVEDAYENGGMEAVMTEMDYIQEDYNYYVTSVSEEAAGVTGDEAATTTPRVTTTAETVEEAADEAEATEETVEATEETEETAEGETEETAEGETAEAEETSEAAEPSDEETDETVEETTEAAAENTEEEDVLADEDDLLSDETATETVPFQNESIITVVNEEDYDNPDDIYWNPSQKAYNKLLEIGEADYGKPFIVEEDEEMYLLVRYDIRERMTEDDLWSESAMANANYTMHHPDYEDLLDTWTEPATITRNAAAYNRYDPFKFDFT